MEAFADIVKCSVVSVGGTGKEIDDYFSKAPKAVSIAYGLTVGVALYSIPAIGLFIVPCLAYENIEMANHLKTAMFYTALPSLDAVTRVVNSGGAGMIGTLRKMISENTKMSANSENYNSQITKEKKPKTES